MHDRHTLIPGFDQPTLHASTVVQIGAGGLGGEVGEGLVRKGVGTLLIFDDDYVQLSDLNRQRFFEEDLHQNKAVALAKNLAKEATDSSLIIGHAKSFETAVESGVDLDGNVVVCAVDNNRTRLNVASYFAAKRPVVFLGVDELADHGYVFVQEISGPCFACALPHALKDEGAGCAKVGAVKDILKVVAGIALYAIDSLLMDRKRAWNFKEITLAGFVPDVRQSIEKRPGCPVCASEVGMR